MAFVRAQGILSAMSRYGQGPQHPPEVQEARVLAHGDRSCQVGLQDLGREVAWESAPKKAGADCNVEPPPAGPSGLRSSLTTEEKHWRQQGEGTRASTQEGSRAGRNTQGWDQTS